jgi:DNA recombination protein RmuC
MFFIILSFLFGGFIAAVFYHFFFKSKTVVNEKYFAIEGKNQNLLNQISVLQERLSAQENEVSKLNKIISETRDLADKIRDDRDLLNQKVVEITTQKILLEKNHDEQKNKIDQLNEELLNSKNLNFEFKSKNDFLEEKLSGQKNEIIELQKNSQQHFVNLANQILEEKSGKFITLNQQNIQAILMPLNESISSFKKRLEDVYEKESRERFSLENAIKNSVEITNKISAEANNLASALKGQVKKQGNWGEMILETILQQSGLERDVHYFKEKSFNDEEGKNLRPDFQINLPDNRLIIVDSKVSLIAYDKFCASVNDQDRAIYLDEHLKSIRKHIEILSEKKYDNLTQSLDFTVMFMPIEPAYLLAMQHDSQLWSEAYAKRILLISASNLIACLRIIEDLWKREKQSKNAAEIMKQGGLLYDKFVNFSHSMETIGRKISGIQDSYFEAMNQFAKGKGNLVDRALKFKNLGLKTSKNLSQELLLAEDFDEEKNED